MPGGSTLTTSAPKSESTVVAAGPAMKLARSTTLRPEKMWSEAVITMFLIGPGSWGPLLEKGRSAFPPVVRRPAEREQERFDEQTLIQARFQPFVHGLDGELDAHRGVGVDLPQDGFGSRDQVGLGHDLVDQPDPMGLLGVDRLAGENELKRPALPDQPGQALGASIARHDSNLHFRLRELRGLGGQPDRARHRQLAAGAEGKAVHGGDDRLAKVLDEDRQGLAVS